MSKPKFVKCPLCNEKHLVDKYGWIISCIGYFELGNYNFELEEFKTGRGEHYRLFKRKK